MDRRCQTRGTERASRDQQPGETDRVCVTGAISGRKDIFEKVAGFGQAPLCYSDDKPAPNYSCILGEGHEHRDRFRQIGIET
jgi:hypothetical protein